MKIWTLTTNDDTREFNVPDYEDAMVYARNLADELQCEIEEY